MWTSGGDAAGAAARKTVIDNVRSPHSTVCRYSQIMACRCPRRPSRWTYIGSGDGKNWVQKDEYSSTTTISSGRQFQYFTTNRRLLSSCSNPRSTAGDTRIM